jgi:hyaluronoglucosaminidase
MTSLLKYRGVIEGFYGPMWSHEERLHLLRHLRGWSMNLYIYSPKDDPYHRLLWDSPYPPAEMRRFAELAGEARTQGVQFAYALSPGNTFEPGNPAHRQAVIDKLRPFIDLGCTFFPIFYDDLLKPFDPAGAEGIRQAEAQAAVMNELAQGIAAHCADARFLFCPTHYATTDKLPYLCRLHELLDPRIETVVTGVDPEHNGVIAHTLSDAGLRRYAGNFGRRPFVWDNFNVHDVAVNVLNWTPYRGRGAHLEDLCSGLVLNPQNVYLFNLPIFGCLGDFLADPRAYDPHASMRRHLVELMGEEGAPLGLVLSQWFTAEWAEYRSAEENLPPLNGPLTPAERACLRETLRGIFTPLTDFEERFRRTRMDPQAAARLLPFATVLQRYAVIMAALCSGSVTPASAAADLEALERFLYRLPASLVEYVKKLLVSEKDDKAVGA